MAFDKRAYNREYYRRHKDLWQKYREDNYPSSGTVTYTTARPEYKPGYGAANSANRSRSYQSSVRNRSHAIQSSNEAIERRKQQEAAQNRRKRADEGMRWDAKGRSNINNYGLAKYRRMRDYLEKDWARASGEKEPTRMDDLNRSEAMRRKRAAAESKENAFKRAAKSYGSAWKTGAKSIKSGITGAAKSYGSAWKTGAKTISKSAEKAKKKAAKFIAKLFG